MKSVLKTEAEPETEQKVEEPEAPLYGPLETALLKMEDTKVGWRNRMDGALEIMADHLGVRKELEKALAVPGWRLRMRRALRVLVVAMDTKPKKKRGRKVEK